MQRFFIIAAFAALSLLVCPVAAQSGTGNSTTETFPSADVDLVSIIANGRHNVWARVMETTENSNIEIVAEYLSTYNHNDCVYKTIVDRYVVKADISGSNGATCDMRFLVTFGHDENVPNHGFNATSDGDVNVEVQGLASGANKVLFYGFNGDVVRFQNTENALIDAMVINSTKSYLEMQNVYSCALSSRGGSKVYHKVAAPRECPSNLDCRHGILSKSGITYAGYGADGSSGDDCRISMKTKSSVSIKGGPRAEITKDVTHHTEAPLLKNADYSVLFTLKLSNSTTIPTSVTVGEDFGSHLSDSERPNYDNPAANNRAFARSLSFATLFALVVSYASLQ